MRYYIVIISYKQDRMIGLRMLVPKQQYLIYNKVIPVRLWYYFHYGQ